VELSKNKKKETFPEPVFLLHKVCVGLCEFRSSLGVSLLDLLGSLRQLIFQEWKKYEFYFCLGDPGLHRDVQRGALSIPVKHPGFGLLV
jgi:hypothetical protein